MELKHYTTLSLANKLMKLITVDFQDKIQHMYFIHPNRWVRGSIKAMTPILPNHFTKKLRIFETENMGLMLELERSGIERKIILAHLEELKANKP
jgi:hypothetical protein